MGVLFVFLPWNKQNKADCLYWSSFELEITIFAPRDKRITKHFKCPSFSPLTTNSNELQTLGYSLQPNRTEESFGIFFLYTSPHMRKHWKMATFAKADTALLDIAMILRTSGA